MRSGRSQLLVALVAVTVGLTAVFSGTAVVAVRIAADAAPDLPAGVDLAAVEDLSEALEREVAVPSTVLAADGSVIGRFKSTATHLRLDEGSLPDHVVAAVLASEDDGYWEHGGFEPSAIARAFFTNIDEGAVAQGGSTITQQVAKMLFTGDSQTLERKVAELRTAIDLEERFSKEEILTAYLNAVYFGGRAFGVEAAAQEYFRKPAAEVSLSEAALLAGVIPAPTKYDPRRNPDGAERRRHAVLDRLESLGWYPSSAIETARVTPPIVHPPKPVFERYPYFLDYVRRYLLDVVGLDEADIYGAGLTIHATMQPLVQKAARDAVARHLPDPDGPTASVVVMDNATGAVLALVGGRDFDGSEVNLALGELGGGTGRQTGSSFKPLVLASAMERGWSLDDRIDAPAEYLPRTVLDPEPVHNYARRGYGEVTLADATRRSINTAYVGLIETIGTPGVAHLAREAGIESLPDPSTVGPSLAIGAYETSPLQMTEAYAAFANEGRRTHATPITAVEPPVIGLDGMPVGAGERVFSVDTARLVTSALQGVVRAGTGTAANIGRPVAAKTGTTNSYSDAWLVGYSPQLTAAVWVGHRQAQIPMRDVNGIRAVTGGSLPAQIWRDVMAVAHHGLPIAPFPAPPDRPASTTTTASPTTSSSTPTSTTSSSSTTTSSSSSSTTSSSTTTAPPTTQPPATTTTTTAPTTTTTTAPTTTTTTAPTTTTTTTTTTAPTTTTTSSTTTEQVPG